MCLIVYNGSLGDDYWYVLTHLLIACSASRMTHDISCFKLWLGAPQPHSMPWTLGRQSTLPTFVTETALSVQDMYVF